MSRDTETIGDIVAEMRGWSKDRNPYAGPSYALVQFWMDRLAGRIEAAYSRAAEGESLRTLHAIEMSERELLDLLRRAIPLIYDLVIDRKYEYRSWEGRESAGHARSLKADIDEGEAIIAEAKKWIPEEAEDVESR